MKVLEGVQPYQIKEPLFEGVRVVVGFLGETYTPEYIQGIAGAAFRIATGCPSRPTCCKLMWTTDLIALLGYDYTEFPCSGPDGEKLTDKMIAAVREQIDAGRPALVWNAMTFAEWDVVCGYDEENQRFLGWGSYWGPGSVEYHTEPWTKAEEWPYGAVLIGEKRRDLDARAAELSALNDAVAHARTIKDKPEESGWYSYEGIQALRKWVESYSNPGKERDLADAYCYDIYHFTHAAAPGFLREIAGNYPERTKHKLEKAAEYMAQEAEVFGRCEPYLGWGSPGGVDEERSRAVVPLLSEVADLYEKAIDCIDEGLRLLAEKPIV